jgi:hypothetical protein
MTRKLLLACLLNLGCFISAASAHYLWVAVSTDADGKATANIYFEESPGPGSGEYLDPIANTDKTWIRTVEQPQPKLLETREVGEPKKRWLAAELSQAAPRSVDCYAKFGVYRYGKTNVLLHYYARNLDVTTHEDLHELARAKTLRLDIVAHDEPEGLELKVLWDGEPAAGRTIYVRGPKGFSSTLKTDAGGEAQLKAAAAGRYTFRTFVEENTPGSEDGQEYSLIRHHGTLVMQLPLEK